MRITDLDIANELFVMVDSGLLHMGWDEGGPLFWPTRKGTEVLGMGEYSGTP